MTQNESPILSDSQAAPAPQPAPLYDTWGWYIPKGSKTVFSARKVRVCVFSGWVMFYDSESMAEVLRQPLTPNIALRPWLGNILRDVDGKKQSLFAKAFVVFYDPRLQPLVVVPIIISLVFSLDPALEIALLLGALGGMWSLFMPGIKKTKSFIAAYQLARGSQL